MSSTVCPKCNYTRKPAETAPDWQCPSCGIVYAKFQPVGAAQSAGGRSIARDLRKRTLLSAGQGDKPGSTALFLYGGLLLFLLIAYTNFHQVDWLKWTLPVFVVSSFLFWVGAYRRKRVVEDVPTSTIAAAAQGYVELQGTVAAATGHSLTARLTGAPAAWYLYIIEEVDRNELERRRQENSKSGKLIDLRSTPYVERDRGSSAVSFILRDKTGECLVDGAKAEIVCDRCQQWEEGDFRYQEWSIRVGDPVYAIGHFTTGGESAESHLNLKAAYAVGGAQKRDAADFAERFDTNRDGKVDAQELGVARAKIREELVRGQTNQGGTHTLEPSPDDRPFLVISGGQQRATTHYGWLALAHLCVFFLSLGTLAYLHL